MLQATTSFFYTIFYKMAYGLLNVEGGLALFGTTI